MPKAKRILILSLGYGLEADNILLIYPRECVALVAFISTWDAETVGKSLKLR